MRQPNNLNPKLRRNHQKKKVAPQTPAKSHPPRENRNPPQAPPRSRAPADNPPSEEDQQFLAKIEGSIIIEKPTISWDEVAGLTEAKAALTDAVITPLRFPQWFENGIDPPTGILLYGPPGTGKSYLAKATAAQAEDISFISVSTADLLSKWVGESEKLVRALFQVAAKYSPSVIFIDEVDSLLGQRSDQDAGPAHRVKNEFLQALDGMKSNMSGVLFLGATNLPWSIDTAMKRRFQKKIYIPLPDAAARSQLFQIQMKKVKHKISDKDLQAIVKATNGFSGADFKILVSDAASRGIRRLQSSQYFKKIDGKWIIAKSDDPQAQKITVHQIPDPENVPAVQITVDDFREALKSVKPTVSPNDLKRYDDWTAEFGSQGA